MSKQSNWEGAYSPADEALDFRDIVFGPLANGAHQTVGVDLDRGRNLGPIIFSEGAPPMTLRAVPRNEGRIQLARTLEPLRVVNRSGQTQNFQTALGVFWHFGWSNRQRQQGACIRQFEATSGDIVFDRKTTLNYWRLASGANRSNVNEVFEVVWQLSGSSNMLFSSVIMDINAWPPDISFSLLKTGSGRITFRGETLWRGSATAEEGVIVVDGPWKVSGDISISPAATLEGKGQINAPVRVQGRLAPGGTEIATLKFAKGLELSGTTEMSLDAARNPPTVQTSPPAP